MWHKNEKMPKLDNQIWKGARRFQPHIIADICTLCLLNRAKKSTAPLALTCQKRSASALDAPHRFQGFYDQWKAMVEPPAAQKSPVEVPIIVISWNNFFLSDQLRSKFSIAFIKYQKNVKYPTTLSASSRTTKKRLPHKHERLVEESNGGHAMWQAERNGARKVMRRAKGGAIGGVASQRWCAERIPNKSLGSSRSQPNQIPKTSKFITFLSRTRKIFLKRHITTQDKSEQIKCAGTLAS